MEKSNKPRVLVDYEKLDSNVKLAIKLNYPEGFESNLIKFPNKDGNTVSALPFETEDTYFLIRMTVMQAQEIIDEDDDYDDEGFLKEEIIEEYEDEFEIDEVEVEEEEEEKGFDGPDEDFEDEEDED